MSRSHPVRYGTLDHWRGLAALAVVFHHTPLYTYEGGANVSPVVSLYHLGWWAVPAFLAISGYCVTGAAIHSPDRWTYLRRRLTRILPPYLFALIVLILFLLLFAPLLLSEPYAVPSPISARAWFGNLTLTALWLNVPILLAPAWSLCYEESYYVIVGLLGRKRLFQGIVCVTCLVFLVRHIGINADSTPIDSYWYAFAAGAVVYQAIVSRRWYYPALLAVAALSLAYRSGLDSVFALHASPQAGGILGGLFALLLLTLHPLDAKLYDLPVLRPLRWCGTRCYSIYLIHWPICKMLATLLHAKGLDAYAVLWPVVTVPVTLLASHLFHMTVERRFMSKRPESPHPPA